MTDATDASWQAFLSTHPELLTDPELARSDRAMNRRAGFGVLLRAIFREEGGR
jgi:hypothetical protein